MSPESTVKTLEAVYDEAADCLRARRKSLRDHLRLLKAGSVSDRYFRETIGFEARTCAVSVLGALELFGTGLEANAAEKWDITPNQCAEPGEDRED